MITVALFQLLNPFIGLVFGREYTFSMLITTIISLLFFVPGLNHTNTIYKDACGLFWQTRYRTLLTAIVNISISVLLANIIPHQEYKIVGVFLGTIIAYVVTIYPIDPKIVYKYVFQRKVYSYYAWLIKAILSTGFAMVCTWSISSLFDRYTWSGFMLQCVIVLIVPNFIYFILNYKSDEFSFYYSMIKGIFKKKK